MPEDAKIMPLPFNERYTPEPMSGCWLWEEHTDKYGYGQLRYNGRQYAAHRLSWILHRGDIPSGQCVLHRCDTPTCVNPNHLFLGTHLDNARDREWKGRGNQSERAGERNSQAKLTETDVKAIRLDTRTYAIIAKDYGISPTQVGNIRRKTRWRHLS
jgi:hypothetical protein